MPENVTITLDTKAQTAGIQATINGLGKVKTSIGSLNEGFSKFAGWLAGFGITLSAGAVAASITKLSKDSIDAADNLGKAAQKAGISIQGFSGLAAAASLSNISLEDLIGTSKHLSDWMEKTGQSGRSLLKVLLEQADAVAAMADGERKIAYVTDIFGKSGQQLIPLLNQGSAAIRRQAEEARQFGAVIGPEFAKKAEDFNDNIGRMHNIVRGFFNTFSDEALTRLIPLQESLIKWSKDNSEAIKQVAKDMAGSVAAIGSALAPLVKMAYTVDSPLARISRWLGEKTAGMHLPGFQPPTPEKKTDLFDDKSQVDEAESERARVHLEILKSKAELSDIDTQITTAEQNSDPLDRAQKLNDLYKKRVEILGSIKQAISQQDLGPNAFTEEGSPASEEALQNLREANSLMKEITITEKKIFDNPELDTFSQRLERNLRHLAKEFQNLGASIADVMTRGVKSAIRGVADGIWDVIDGTRTWGEIFQQVGRRIISDLIEIAIQELFLDQLKRGLAFAWKAFVTFMRGEDVVEANATEAAKAPALAANATLASIESWGIAVVIGLAAIGAILAMMGTFETGGVVRGGRQPIIVNERGTESVLNARATAMLGEETINRLNAGIISGAGLESRMASTMGPPRDLEAQRGYAQNGAAMPTQAQQSQRLHFLLVDSRNQQAAKDFMASSAGRAMVLDIVKNNKTEAGI